MREVLSRPKVAVSVVFVSAMFMSIMDIAIVNVALPSIGRDLHVGPTSVDAVSIGYLVSLAVVIPASGWMGDRFGGKRVLLTAIVIFTVASALCGLSRISASWWDSVSCRASAAGCSPRWGWPCCSAPSPRPNVCGHPAS